MNKGDLFTGESGKTYRYLGEDGGNPTRETVQEIQSSEPELPPMYSRPIEAARAATRGMTMGWGDEAGAGLASLGVVATTDKGLSDLPEVYSDIKGRMNQQAQAYSSDYPVESFGAEMAGGIATGIAGGMKLAGTEAGKRLIANTPRWLQASALGGSQGAIYGAGQSDDNRLRGGAIGGAVGAVAAPVVGLIADKGSSLIGSIMSWAKNKLTDTPRNEAIRAIRSALQAEGLNPDEAVNIYKSLGKEGMLADLGENFRAAGRAAVDVPGPAKAVARNALNTRQMGQQGRLLKAAESAVGKRADDLASTVSQVIERRSQQATPAYEAAFQQTPRVESEELSKVLARPAMQKALRMAKTFALNMGDDFDEGTLKHLHYAKMALDKSLKQAKYPRDMMQTKTDLLAALKDASPAYDAARAQYAGESELLNAAELGQKFLKTAPSDLAALVKDMTPSEKEMFQLGAIGGIRDYLDNVQFTHDAATKLANNASNLRRLQIVFDDQNAAKQFLEAVGREWEMGRTRNVITGGSQTSTNLGSQKWMGDAIQPEGMTAFLEPKFALVSAIAKEVLGKKPLSQEALGEMSNMLLTQGMSEAEVRSILQSPKTMQFLTNLNRQFLSRAGAAGAVGPATQAVQ